MSKNNNFNVHLKITAKTSFNSLKIILKTLLDHSHLILQHLPLLIYFLILLTPHQNFKVDWTSKNLFRFNLRQREFRFIYRTIVLFHFVLNVAALVLPVRVQV